VGHIPEAPTYRLDYAAGSYPLILSVMSRADTTLVVRDPSGGWLCRDDRGGGPHPYLLLGAPRTGTYDIFVGTKQTGTAAATLYVSAVGADPGSGGLGGGPDPNMPAKVAELSLAVAATGGATSVAINAGGIFHAGLVGDDCAGYITAPADVRVRLSAGAGPMEIEVRAQADTTLVVRGPDGVWRCDDDAAGFPNPWLRYETPAAGAYDIWVGTYARGIDPAARTTFPTVPATLVVAAGIGEDGALVGGPDPALPALFGQASVAAGFSLVPFSLDVKAGGPLDVVGIGAECPLHATHAPSLDLEYTAETRPLTFSATAGDAALPVMVHTSSGQWVCDAEAVRFEAPRSGHYDVWVGSGEAGPPRPAILWISEEE
jgi:hypothetical protein